MIKLIKAKLSKKTYILIIINLFNIKNIKEKRI